MTRFRNNLSCFFWFLTLVGYMFQSYDKRLSSLIIPCLAITVILNLKSFHIFSKSWLYVYAGYFIYLLLSIIISLINGNDVTSIIRFFLILTIIPIAENIEIQGFSIEWKIFKILSVIKFITIAIIWIEVFVTKNYLAYRACAKAIGGGDIYIVNGIPRVQLLGTSLFVMAMSYETIIKNKITLFTILMALGAFFAGNQAYILGMAVFFVFYYFIHIREKLQKKRAIFITLPVMLIGIAAFVYYAATIWEMKSDFSNLIRQEQLGLLLNTNSIWGRGLGNAITGTTTFRTYNSNAYFEVQTAYIFNQIGTIGLALFYFLTISPYLGKKNKYRLATYLVYLIYTFWNPYCFDSTHIITVLMITNIVEQQSDVNTSDTVE